MLCVYPLKMSESVIKLALLPCFNEACIMAQPSLDLSSYISIEPSGCSRASTGLCQYVCRTSGQLRPLILSLLFGGSFMQGGQPDSIIKFGPVSLWSVQHLAPPVTHNGAESGNKIQRLSRNDEKSRFYLQSDHHVLDSQPFFHDMPCDLEQ